MRATAADWDLLNAYVDDELGGAAATALEARLRIDPELRRALNRIRAVKRELARLRPSDAPETPASRRRFAVVKRAAAVAATLVVAIGLAAGVAMWRSVQPGWAEQAETLHEELSQNAYAVEDHHAVQLVSSGTALEFQPPDLTESRLYLVDVVTRQNAGREAIALHYRGMRGCRLTIVAIEAPEKGAETWLADRAPDGTLVATWHYVGFRFAVIAHSMDPARFRSVADYAQVAIAESVRNIDDLRIAMAERYRAAQPCA